MEVPVETAGLSLRFRLLNTLRLYEYVLFCSFEEAVYEESSRISFLRREKSVWCQKALCSHCLVVVTALVTNGPYVITSILRRTSISGFCFVGMHVNTVSSLLGTYFGSSCCSVLVSPRDSRHRPALLLVVRSHLCGICSISACASVYYRYIKGLLKPERPSLDAVYSKSFDGDGLFLHWFLQWLLKYFPDAGNIIVACVALMAHDYGITRSWIPPVSMVWFVMPALTYFLVSSRSSVHTRSRRTVLWP